MPAYVADGAAGSYRPELLLALEVPGHIILGFETCKKAELGTAMKKLYTDLSAKGDLGDISPPEVARTSVPELAEILRSLAPNTVAVRCAPTPELDPIMESMLERFGRGDGEPQVAYLEQGLSEQVVKEFYRGTKELYGAAPWRKLPPDLPIEIDIPSMGIDSGVVTVIGQSRESFGYIHFQCLADFQGYVRMATKLGRGEEPVSTPAHVALNFDPTSEVAPALRREQLDHGWEVPKKNVFPQLYLVDEDFVSAPPDNQDLERATVISKALAAWASKDLSKITLHRPWSCDRVVHGTAGPAMVTLRSSQSLHRDADAEAFDIMAAAFDPDDHALDEEWAEELINLFLEAPEGAQADGQWVGAFMQYLASYEGCTVAKMTPGQFEEVLFRLFPRKVSVDASAAAEIVDEMSAFMRFLVRQFALRHGEECLALLSGDATARLRRGLSDPSNFGMAKSFFMQGQAAGYDMASERGMKAFTAAYNRDMSRGLPPRLDVPQLRASSPMKTKTAPEKNKAKAQRRARKSGKH
jgi:hypothetical protein